MKDINIITLQDLDDTHFDTTNSDGSNKIKLKPRDNSLGGVSLTGLPVESGEHKDWLVLHKGKLALSTPTWLRPTGYNVGTYIYKVKDSIHPTDNTRTYWVSDQLGKEIYVLGFAFTVGERGVPDATFTITGLDQDGVTTFSDLILNDYPEPHKEKYDFITSTDASYKITMIKPWTWRVTDVTGLQSFTLLLFVHITKPGMYKFISTATLGEGLGEDSIPFNNSDIFVANIVPVGADTTMPFQVYDLSTKELLLNSEFKGHRTDIANNRLNVYSDKKSMKGRVFKIIGSKDIYVHKLPANKKMEEALEVYNHTPYSESKSMVLSPMAESFLKMDRDATNTGKMVYEGGYQSELLATNDEVEFNKLRGLLIFKTSAQDSTSDCATLMYAIEPNDIKNRNSGDITKANPYVMITTAQATDVKAGVCTLEVREHDIPDEVQVLRGESDHFSYYKSTPSLLSSDRAKWIGAKAPDDLVLIENPNGPSLCPDVDTLLHNPDVESLLIKVPAGEPYFRFFVYSNGCFEFKEHTIYSNSLTGKHGIEITGLTHLCAVSVQDAEPGAYVEWGPLRVECVDE